MAPLILHSHQASPPGSAVSMLANLLGLDIESRQVDLLGKANKSEEFLKLNPMGTIPVLEDGDFIISESHAILKYLLDKYGGDHSRLYPSDVRVRARVDTCLFFNAGVFFLRMKNIALPSLLEGLPGPSERQLEDIDLAYGVIEEYLRHHKYVAADHLTLADIALASTAAPMEGIKKIDEKRFPRCKEWLALLAQEPWYRGPSSTCVTTFTAAVEGAWKRNKQSA